MMDVKPNVSFENTAVAFARKSDTSLKKMYWMFRLMHYPFWMKVAIGLGTLSLRLQLPVKGLIRKTVFEQFCGGESIDDCRGRMDELATYRIGTILDYSVEGKKEISSFEETKEQILQIIHLAKGNPYMPFAVFKVSGIANVDVLTKVQSGQALDHAERDALDRAESRISQIFQAAADAGVRVMVDAEESWFQDVIDRWVRDACQKYNRDTAIIYNTYQMYRHDMLRKLRDAHHHAVAHGYFLGAKLVRGAYMEKERARAEEMSYTSPIHASKEGTDRDFDQAVRFCINNKQRVFLVCGSHNELSNLMLSELVDLHGMKRSDPRVYFAQLYGMSDAISFNLSRAGYNVAKYLPYGPVQEVVPYLTRRVEENSGIAGQSSREYTQIKLELTRRKQSKAAFPKIG